MWIGKQANALFDEGNSGMVAPSNKNINMQGRPRKDGTLSIYETPAWGLLDKKSIKVGKSNLI